MHIDIDNNNNMHIMIIDMHNITGIKLNMPIWDLYSLIDELYSHDLIDSDE